MPKNNYALDMAKRVRQGTLAQVGRHLRMLRTALGHSQQDWAYALQITPQVLNKWESGKRQPNIEVLFRICDSFGCSLDFIFRGKMRASVRDISPELQAKLIAVYGADAFSYQVSPVEPPRPPDQSGAAALPDRKPRKKSARQSRGRASVSARQKPPAAPGGSSKS